MKIKIICCLIALLTIVTCCSVFSASASGPFDKNNKYYKEADQYVPDGYCNPKDIVYYFKLEDGFDLQFYRGDANLDGKINIKDVSEIQKNVAGMKKFNIQQLFSADIKTSIENDCVLGPHNKINVLDATFLQKYLIGIRTENSMMGLMEANIGRLLRFSYRPPSKECNEALYKITYLGSYDSIVYV